MSGAETVEAAPTGWLKNVWYVAGFQSELGDTGFVARRFLGTPVVMLRTGSGALAALEDLCPHRLMPLSFGKRVGDEMQCGYHGLRFSAAGRCTLAPGQSEPPAKACVTTFPLEARHGFLFIWMGERELADPALIPDLHWNDHPAWSASRGYHRLNADFRLANDNLLDLAHETYVHGRTIGNDEEESIADFPLVVQVEGDGFVRAHRDMPDIVPPPFFAMVLDHTGRIDRWQTAIHVAPSYNMTDFGVYPVGTPRDKAFRSHVLHLLTPESDRATHYFWSLTRNYRLGDEALTESIRQAIAATFDEDAVVLETQQRQLDIHGGNVPRTAIRLDEAPGRARRLLEALVRHEGRDPRFVFRPPTMVGESVPAPNVVAA